MARYPVPESSASGGLPNYDRTPPGSSEDAGGGLDSGEILRTLRRRWGLILAITVIVFAIAYKLIPPDAVVYRARASIVLNDSRGRLPANVMGGTGIAVQSPEYMTSQIQVLLSRSVLGTAVDREGLQLVPPTTLPSRFLTAVSVDPDQQPISIRLQFAPESFRASLVESDSTAGQTAPYGDTILVEGVSLSVIGSPGPSTALVQVIPRDNAIAGVRQRLAAAPREAAAILDLSYVDRDPDRAARTLNAVAHAFEEHNMGAAREGARVYREFVEQQLAQADRRLEQAREALTNFRNASPYYDSQERMRVEQTELLSLDSQREQLQADQRAYATFLRRVENASDEEIDRELTTLMAGTGATSSPLLTQLFSQLSQYRSEMERQLAAGIAPTNPQVEQLTTLIANTRRSVIDASRIQVRALGERIAALATQRERTMSRLRTLPSPEGEQIRLEQEVALAQGTAQSLRAEHQRAQLLESLDLGQVQILDAAAGAVPELSGNRRRSLAFALLFGLLLGGTGALAREYSDRSIRRRHEAEAHLLAPGLAIIPPIAPQPDNGGWRSSLLRRKLTQTESNGGQETRPEYHDLAADAYRKLRTNLAFIRSTDELRTLVVTSSTSDEGKTTTAANLAVAFARQGRRVLLADCDLRRPRLHTIFGAPASPGFIDALTGRVSMEDCIAATGEENLLLLPRGEFDAQAVELISGSSMERLVAQLRAAFELVIFDTSPLLLTPDAAPLAALADGVLLVVRAGLTARTALGQVSHELDVVGAQLLGFVLNDPDSVAAEHGEYYSGQYYKTPA